MNKFFRKAFFYSFLFFISYFMFSAPVFATAPQELKDAINQKSQELQDINNQIQDTQKNLQTSQGQSKTLQQEITKINSSINQINLSIQSSQITIQKLQLEIQSTQYDIQDIEDSLVAKKQAIINLLQEFQQTDDQTPLIIFLKNKSLADSVLEAQSLADLDGGLSIQMEDLKNMKVDLANKLQESADQKQQTQAETINLQNKQIILKDTKSDKQTVLTQSKNQEKVYQQSLTALQEQQAQIAAEIEKMDEELRLKIDPSALPTKRPGVLLWPVSGAITQGYGATNFALHAYAGKWHNGIDIGIPIGTPVVSAEKGTVAAVGNQDKYCYRGAYGKFIVIEHENNLTTLYAHLSLQIVKEGATVERGQLIGYTGNTGYATGPHLHFTVFASQTFRMGPSNVCGPMPYGGDLNPLDYL